MKCPHLLAAALIAFSLAGCVSTTRIEAVDNHLFVPSLRASVNLTQSTEAPSEPQNGHAIEFEVSGARGSDSQSLSGGQSPVILNGMTFQGPLELKNEFEFSFADVSWRWRKFSANRSLGFETFIGLGYAWLDLTVSSPTQQASQHFTTLGPQGGLGLIWRLQHGASLQARIAGFVSAREGVNRASRAEVFLVKALGENITARAGYAAWEVKGQDLAGMSDFRLRFSGPSLGLQFDFSP